MATDPTSSGRVEGRVPGARRQKVLGYIRAANELRQSYQSNLGPRADGEDEVPGAFPDVEIVRSGDEEMLLFPSYAREHHKKKTMGSTSSRDVPGSHETPQHPQGTGDAEYWRKEWQRYEDDNAIVDVDVRGWIYMPQKGPLNRRNRLLVAVARRLSGISAPTGSPAQSRDSSVVSSYRDRLDERFGSREEELAAREADRLTQHGQREADAAWRGGYSTDPDQGLDSENPDLDRSDSPPPPPFAPETTSAQVKYAVSGVADDDDDPGRRALSKRQSWNQPGNMSREELFAANEQLMMRLKPFMSAPLTNTPITIFFFNNEKSRSKSVNTNDSGHFNVRAALDFIPTSIRVLASEKLSATEDVIVTDPRGVSLVSDIDDTIKHSAIASGAREIFKNTFIRELGDLTIQGVKEWYTKMASMGVKLHYVSNSPWQLYPLLRSYFSLAGLPPGSFHLKQYSGMLQGIFEPAAERKKGSLDRIMHDFPERKFILVGDSGEADLEVYLDVVLANPRRILGVFIRDVTTPLKAKGFFDQSVPNIPPDSMISSRDGHHLSAHNDDSASRPGLPTRAKTTADTKPHFTIPDDLIDFTDEPEPLARKASTGSLYSDDMMQLQAIEQRGNHAEPPTKPNKPSNLRQISNASPVPVNHEKLSSPPSSPESISRRANPPPKPRRPSTVVDTSPFIDESRSRRPAFSSSSQHQSARPAPPEKSTSTRSFRPHLQSRTTAAGVSNALPGVRDEEGYVASARRQITTAYNALPTLRSQSPARSVDGSAPPVPPRRGLTSYPAAAARWATGASGGDPAAGGDGGAPPGSSYTKKEEVWRRRWLHAEDVMRRNGVILKTWRVGSDVMDECVRLVEKAIAEADRESHRGSNGGGE